MPLNRRRYYPTSQGAIVTIALVGCAAAALRQQIPPPSPDNVLERSQQPYLKSSVLQQIPWKPLSPITMSEARRSGKPIMLVIGEPASRTGRLLDKSVFRDPEVAEYLTRNYFSIRVDASVEPYAASMYDPIIRSSFGWDPTCQIWFLDSEGKKFGSRVFEGSQIGIPANKFLEALKYMRSRFSAKPDSMTTFEVPGASQASQASELLFPSEAEIPDEIRYISWLEDNLDPESGGWPLGKLFRLNPPAFEFLLLTREHDLLERAIEPILESTILDWTGGGFFYQARQSGWRQVDYDKYAMINCDMAAVLAKMNASFPASKNRTIYRKIAEDTFDSLTTSFVRDGLIVPWRVGDERGFNRSARSSYSLRWLSDQGLSQEITTDLNSLLGLDVGRNQAMIPRIPDLDVYEKRKSETDALINLLRTKRPETFEGYSEQLNCDSASFALARLLETSVFLDDSERLGIATDMFARLRKFRVGVNDVIRDLDEGTSTPAYLGDYLGFSDAALQMYKATGDWTYFNEAETVFDRALEIFAGPSPGVLVTSPNDPSLELPPDCKVPEIIDRLSSSLAGTSIRLALEFEAGNRVIEKTKSAGEYRQFAFESLRNVGRIANELQRRFSGIFQGSYIYNRDTIVSVTGENSVSTAQEIARTYPGLRVFPIERVVKMEPSPSAVPSASAKKITASQESDSAQPVTIYLKDRKIGPLTLEQALAVITENRL
jgi:uncharacterized protein YyaL (SSP411 family)